MDPAPHAPPTLPHPPPPLKEAPGVSGGGGGGGGGEVTDQHVAAPPVKQTISNSICDCQSTRFARTSNWMARKNKHCWILSLQTTGEKPAREDAG